MLGGDYMEFDTPETPRLERQIQILREENQVLREENLLLTDCLLEMSTLVYEGGE